MQTYARARFVVYQLSAYETGFMDACLKFPETFLWWIWLAVLCGVQDTGEVTSIYHRWQDAESVHPCRRRSDRDG